MPTTVPDKIITRGLAEISTQKLNDSFNGYSSTRVKWEGHHKLIITPSQNKQLLASGDDPAWGEVKGPVICDVELDLYALPLSLMPELLGVEYSADDGVSFTSDAKNVYVGIDAIVTVQGESGNVRRKTILYKVGFDLPEISHETVSEDNVAVADLTIKGKAYPVFYSKVDGSQGNKTLSIFESTQTAKWAANENTIVFPSSASSAAIEEDPSNNDDPPANGGEE